MHSSHLVVTCAVQWGKLSEERLTKSKCALQDLQAYISGVMSGTFQAGDLSSESEPMDFEGEDDDAVAAALDGEMDGPDDIPA